MPGCEPNFRIHRSRTCTDCAASLCIKTPKAFRIDELVDGSGVAKAVSDGVSSREDILIIIIIIIRKER